MKSQNRIVLYVALLFLFLPQIAKSLTPQEEASIQQGLDIGYFNLLYLREPFLPHVSKWDQLEKRQGEFIINEPDEANGDTGSLDLDFYSFSPVRVCDQNRCQSYTSHTLGLSYQFINQLESIRYGGMVSYFGIDSRPESVNFQDGGGLQERIVLEGNLEFHGFYYRLSLLVQHLTFFELSNENADNSAAKVKESWKASTMHELKIPFGLYANMVTAGAVKFETLPYIKVGERLFLRPLDSLLHITYEHFDNHFETDLYGLLWEQKIGSKKSIWSAPELIAGARFNNHGKLYSYRLGLFYRFIKTMVTHQLRDLGNGRKDNLVGFIIGAGIHTGKWDNGSRFLIEVLYSRNYLNQLEIVAGARDANYWQLKISQSSRDLFPSL